MARYELRHGKYGAYFHDTERGGNEGSDMHLEHVLTALNRKEELKQKVVLMRGDFSRLVGSISNKALNQLAVMWGTGMEPRGGQ